MTTTRRTKGFLLGGLLLAFLLAAVVSHYASSKPDGLEKVAADKGIDASEKEHAMASSPLADYSAKGVDNAWLSGGLAGIAGVTVTFAAGGALVFLVRRRTAEA